MTKEDTASYLRCDGKFLIACSNKAKAENIAFSTNITNPPYGNSAVLKRNSYRRIHGSSFDNL